MEQKAANHGELRMALVFRADLDAMTRGKSEGQAAHSALEAGVALAREDADLADRYLGDGQPKVVLETPDLAGLERIVAKARSRDVRVTVITDLGRTCFVGETTTCALIGPMSKTDSNAITRGAKMRDDDAATRRLRAERDFLLDRVTATREWSEPRWTGASSSALVAVAFGRRDPQLPSDAGDLQACYLTVMRMPAHLVSDAVLAQLALGEAEVDRHHADDAAAVRERIAWPGADEMRRLGREARNG